MTAVSLDGRLDVHFTLNGNPVSVATTTNRVLADLLRDDLYLKGTKIACGRTVCGACNVLVDGTPRASCSTFAFEVDGCAVTTIEGLESSEGLDPVQAAFARKSAFQCGFCTSGMIVLAKGLLAENPDPDRATIKDWISSNVCRCTGYQLIIEAIEEAAAAMRTAGGAR
ncbi:(2Fe-2S)-binding protein [Amorphus orientalis]|uniref:Carbon-monoxide dehydrogenase small subunit n=1 Tax=Amorphus orientalis TaxID=649198 RepID=A0AAE4ASY5_9HYPH|nr:(2Fe-2S)-binding protein [Amorphus orientalis]MDQ0314459.1 carbon-monoxide dehydrogenase small subunit [Amorphus orientalis]